MKTVAVILQSLDDGFLQARDGMAGVVLGAADHVVVIFLEKNKWFMFNDPHAMLESEKILSLEQKLHRKAIVAHMEKVSQFARKINKNAEISKLVISGDEKYKIRKCLVCLEIEAAVFVNTPRRRSLFEFLVQSLEDYVLEAMRIPIVRIPAAPRT